MANELYKIYSSLDPISHSGDTVQITVSQNLLKTGSNVLNATGPVLQVAVQGPQLKLTEDDLSGVYPAPGSNDSPDNFLPHIALTRRTLPWERIGPGPLPPAPNQPTVPWLALLVITQADLAMPGILHLNPGLGAAEISARSLQTPQNATSSVSAASNIPTPILLPMITPPLVVNSGIVKDLATSDPKAHAALLATHGIADTDQINYIAIPNATLKKILPAANDLALLCSAKEVNQDGVTTFTSIVVSGRLPDAGDNDPSTPPALHMALLVSLEQRGDVYARLNDAGANTLVVLHSWTFTPSKGADFEEVCQMIGYRPNGGVLRFGNLPADVKDPSQAPLSGGFDALLKQSGFFSTPLDHSEAGNVIWRSPLRPFPPAPRSKGVALRAEPEELENQPADMPLDYSHATAFELGRLLAVADPGIREDLREVHSFFRLPEAFVAMSALPQILQKPYWGVDMGQATLPSEQAQLIQALENPWSFGGPQSLLGIQNTLGPGDVSGISAQAVAWQATVTSQLNEASAPVAGAPSQIDIGQVSEASLALQFPEVLNAGMISGKG